MTEIVSDAQTGIITIKVSTFNPELSQNILQTMLDELELYNSQIRRSQAKESARYLERELKVKEEELAASEDVLEDFQKANQNWYNTSDPEIITSLARLRRNVEINSQAYLLLREQYELARLNVQKDIPVVSLLDTPTLPSLKSGPRRKMIILIIGILAAMVSFAFILIREAYRNAVKEGKVGELNDLSGKIARNFPVVNRLLFKRKGTTKTEA